MKNINGNIETIKGLGKPFSLCTQTRALNEEDRTSCKTQSTVNL